MQERKHIEKGGYKYLTSGTGKPIIILHGLMGGLGNFEGFISYFPIIGYQIFMPELPVYTASLLDTNVKYFAKFINNFKENTYIYPNPVNNILNINTTLNDYTVEIYTISGQLISKSKNIRTFDFSNFNSGIYLLKLITDQKFKIFKVFLQKNTCDKGIHISHSLRFRSVPRFFQFHQIHLRGHSLLPSYHNHKSP